MEIQEEAVKVQNATAKSLGNRIIENARALEKKYRHCTPVQTISCQT